MDDRIPSTTAMATSLIRAHHARCDPAPLFRDSWGDTLVPQTFKDRLVDRILAAGGAGADADRARVLDEHVRDIPSYAGVVLRSRYAEDALERAVRGGVRQYALIGAGFDSYALRRPEYARAVAVFEIDHPATQEFKRRRLAACAIAEPPLTYFIAADLARESLTAALTRAPFRFDEPAFFSWLGVTIYLTREANAEALRAIARCAAPGSELVFTYTDQRAFEAAHASEGFRRMQRNADRLGEPFLTGFDPQEMSRDLAALGLELLEDLDGVALMTRYGRAQRAPFVSSRHTHVARARRTPGPAGD